MKTTIRYRLMFAAMFTALWAGSCSKETPVSYTNPFDPASENYVPTAPSTLIAVARPDTGVSLQWKDLSLGEEGFILERKTSYTGTYQQIAVLPAGSSEYFDRYPIQTYVNYCYRITPVAKGRSGKYSNEAVAFFSFPSPWKPTISLLSKTSFKVAWNMSHTVLPIIGYILERSANNASFVQIASVDKNTFTFIDNDIDTTKSYRYRIKAYTQNNQGPYTVESYAVFSWSAIEKLYTVNLGRSVHSLAFSRDGKRFAASGISCALRVWNAADGSLARDLNSTVSNVTTLGWPFPVAFSPDGSLVASEGDGSNGSAVRIWNINDGSLVRNLHYSSGASFPSLCFVNGNAEIAGGRTGGDILIWNIESDSVRMKWTAVPGGQVNFLSASQDPGKLYSGGGDGVFHTWSTVSVKEWTRLSGLPSAYYSISSDEQYLTSGESIRNFPSGTVKTAFTSFSIGPTCLSYDNKLMLSRSPDQIVIGNASTGTLITRQSVPGPDIYTYSAVAASPVSMTFISTGSTTGSVDMWRMQFNWQFN